MRRQAMADDRTRTLRLERGAIVLGLAALLAAALGGGTAAAAPRVGAGPAQGSAAAAVAAPPAATPSAMRSLSPAPTAAPTGTPSPTSSPSPTPTVTSVQLAAPKRWVAAKAFIVKSVVVPRAAGVRVALLSFRGGGWVSVGTALTGGDGSVRFRRRIDSPQRVRFRARTDDQTGTPVFSPTVAVQVRYVLLRAVGDVNLGDGPANRMAAYGAGYPWEKVGDYLRAADIAFANLECAVSNRGTPESKKYTFRGSPSALKAARTDGGIDVVSCANNHTRDFGTVALSDTLKYLKQFGIARAGAGKDLADAHAPAILTRDGLKVAFLAYSTIEDNLWGATASRGGVASAFPVSRMKKEIARAKKKADVVVVSFHWGIELAPSPEAEQVMLGKAAIDAGADVILGHHPHRLQKIVRYKRALLDYSLGNFVFAPPATPDVNKQTLVLSVDLSGRGFARYRTRKAYIANSQPYFTQ